MVCSFSTFSVEPILCSVPTSRGVDFTRQTKKRRRRFFSTDLSCTENIASILEDEEMLAKIPLEDVRNFCFIAHIDHGKSSLSSRILELTGNLGRDAQRIAWEKALEGESGEENSSERIIMHASGKEKIELLDTLAVEQERGITVKASTASMLYCHPSAVGPTGRLLVSKKRTVLLETAVT